MPFFFQFTYLLINLLFLAMDIFVKKSAAINYYRPQYTKKTREYLASLIYLAFSPKKELGWLAKNINEKYVLFSPKKNEEEKYAEATGFSIITPDSPFLYRGKVYMYKVYKFPKDNGIIELRNILSIRIAEQLYPEEQFAACLIKNKDGKIINCAWVSEKHHVTIFQDEPNYQLSEVTIEPLQFGKEFRLKNKKWYTCTEKGKCILSELPII